MKKKMMMMMARADGETAKVREEADPLDIDPGTLFAVLALTLKPGQ
jgi:hypothetical protein